MSIVCVSVAVQTVLPSMWIGLAQVGIREFGTPASSRQVAIGVKQT